jgi:hypothetical protein
LLAIRTQNHPSKKIKQSEFQMKGKIARAEEKMVRAGQKIPCPGISDNFRLPRTGSDQALVSSSRAFIEAATPLRSEFIARELPATFIEDLNSALSAFENAVNSQNVSREKRVAATTAVKNALAGGMSLKRELDPIVRNKFEADPATLAAWTSASHVERAPKAKPAPPAQPHAT